MKFNRIEKNWILYDVGNSAYSMLSTTIMPIVFNQFAEGNLSPTSYLAYWGYATGIATILVALLGPVLGTVSDGKGKRKILFFAFAMLGILSTAGMPLIGSWFLFLIFYVISKVGFNGSLIFYDSMLNDVTTPERMDHVSTHGYAWGYIGSCVPFILSILLMFFYKNIGITLQMAIIGAFLLNASWWFVFTLPIYKSYQQVHYVKDSKKMGESFRRLLTSFSEIAQNKKILFFLIAFFFYIDGVYTIIDMATAYGTSLGLSAKSLMLALLTTQLVAFPCALGFSRISGKYKTHRLLSICVVAYFCIALYAIQLDQVYEFWILAVAVGMFQGAIQALSRSFYAKIIPPEKSGEYFGLYDIFGKGAAVLGTFLVGTVTQMTGNQSFAIATLAILFALGFFFFQKSIREDREG